MTKGELFKKDWFLVLVLGLLFLVGVANSTGLLEGLERTAYDAGIRTSSHKPGAADRIAIIAIDDDSIRKLGRWPWPRSVLADMVDWLAAAKAKVIGLQVFLNEPQTDPGLAYIHRLGDLLGTRAQAGPVSDLLREAEQELNTDQRLAASVPAAGNVLLPMYFTLGQPIGNPDAPLPDFVQRNHLGRVFARGQTVDQPPSTTAVGFPLADFGSQADGIGHLNLIPDTDGEIRSDALVVEYYKDYYPSLALLMAARSLNLKPSDITVNLGEGVQLGKLTIRTDDELRMYTSFYRRPDGGSPFATYSFSDVRNGKIPPAQFENRIVIIGPTAAGLGNREVTPISEAMDGPSLTAQVVTSILNQDFYTRPSWVLAAEVAAYFAVLLYLMFVLSRMPAATAAVVSLVLLVVLVGAGQYMLLSEQVWMRTVSPALLLLVGHVLLTTKRFFLTERQKQRVETDSAQTNRMLGLAFQNQGQLDMAIDKFRSLPVDDSVCELIYNLALDFERKRQFSKAAAAYDYILGHNASFRDAGERRKRASQVDSTLILGGGRTSPGGTLVLDQVDHKPTLGRYEVERELGKGAMGAVYLGRDPRINRVVAIKTMALSAEFEGTDLDQARERFFREAETAGRLNHRNIVTIYDAGEEHDLAYIAMEFLEGKDLTRYTHAGQLLPVAVTAQVICDVADALTYAHAHDVVHRDIKPANIMYDERSKTIKVTDFGIARITASSRTRTGVVLGTPSYMSPEQVAGKHVDGRSDLFSLGVMAFQLFTGRLPFTSESLPTLMYQIANTAHPDITALRPELPDCLGEVFNKALAKDPDRRFQTGTEFSQALRQCLATPAPKPKKNKAETK
jgi:CHASE2 domain-containing sensor protein/tRNA A-37 threonylcarbamoyl transferase component Bud32